MRYRRRFRTAISECVWVEKNSACEAPWKGAASTDRRGCAATGSSRTRLDSEVSLKKKRYAYRSWGAKGVVPTPLQKAASFDQIVKNMGLSPAQYLNSAELKEWVRSNRGQEYVPSDLLTAWGFEVEP